MSGNVLLSALSSRFNADNGIAVTNIHILDSNDLTRTVFVIDQTTRFGETGPTGSTGPTGATGAQGVQGNPGRPYTVGCTGGFGFNSPTIPGGVNEWIQSYLIDTPPAIQWSPPISTPTSIYFSWLYPTQINVGFVSGWLPNIQSFTAVLNNTSILVDADNTQFINNHDDSEYASAIVLSNQAGTNGFETVTFPDEVTTQLAYVCYNVTLEPSGNTLQVWYSNYSNQIPNQVTIPFDIFTSV